MNHNDTVQPFTHPGAQNTGGVSNNGVVQKPHTTRLQTSGGQILRTGAGTVQKTASDNALPNITAAVAGDASAHTVVSEKVSADTQNSTAQKQASGAAESAHSFAKNQSQVTKDAVDGSTSNHDGNTANTGQSDTVQDHESPTGIDTASARPAPKNRKRRWGDRSDGRRVRTNPPMARVSPYIMKTRNTSCNMFEDVIDMTAIDKYIKEKRLQGNKTISLMHILLAAYARVVSQMPAVNRFIAHQEVYTRDGDIWVSLTIKKEMTLDSPDTVVKIHLTPWDTVEDVACELNRVVEEYRQSPGGDFDDTAAILNKFPGLFLRFAVGFLRFLDYFGKIPKKLIDLSPFHGSLFITSIGSLGIPTIFHHLYDFGNIPIFLSFGAKEHKYELTPEGRVERKSFVRYTIVMDERICDGFYYAAALKYLRKLLKNPWLLDTPPQNVVEDID